ncbi:MAG: hypothetical protein LBJ65_27550 [Burkholderia sp.]|jgi:hypothetical protein|uniref:hypothetical protein n=1 Tax=Burkholderia sp. TaxID=36773 RepID=UPI002829996B|nr:hypothetical protein [Burkholderia sp.]MDR0245371.1 hypothetical protein [Burkholderia sp.]
MSINDCVVDALVRDRKLKAESAWTVENHEKYSTLKRTDDDARRREAGREVFSPMRNLNERLATLSRGRDVHYIGLGPEPVKTTELMKAVSADDLDDQRLSPATF